MFHYWFQRLKQWQKLPKKKQVTKSIISSSSAAAATWNRYRRFPFNQAVLNFLEAIHFCWSFVKLVQELVFYSLRYGVYNSKLMWASVKDGVLNSKCSGWDFYIPHSGHTNARCAKTLIPRGLRKNEKKKERKTESWSKKLKKEPFECIRNEMVKEKKHVFFDKIEP